MSLLVKGQDYKVEVQFLSVEEGLSNRWVNSITQTQDGYVWIGTNYGLNRYDGQKFKQYTSFTHQLQSDKIKIVHATSNDLLWLFYGEEFEETDLLSVWEFSGIDIMDQKSEEVLPFEEVLDDLPFSLKDLAGTHLDEKAHLWLWTKAGKVYRYDGALKEMYTLDEPSRISSMIKGRAGDLYLLVGKKFLHVSESGVLVSEEELPFFAENMYQDKENTLWLESLFNLKKENEGEPYLYYKKVGAPFKLYTPEFGGNLLLNTKKYSYYTGTYFDKEDRLWSYDMEKLELIDPANNWTYNFKEKTGENPEVKLRCFFFDRNNIAFIGTENGFFIINVEQNKINSLFKNDPIGVSARAILDYSADSLLVCTYEKSYWYNKKTEELSIIPALNGKSQYGGIIDSKGRIILGTHSEFVEHLKMPSGEVTRYTFKENDNIIPAALNVYEDKKTKRIWVGLTKGLAYLDEKEGALVWYEPKEDFLVIKDLYVQCFYQNEKGLWIGTSNGLFLYQEGKGMVQEFNHFPNSNINYIHEDKAGIFWLSTLGGGLLRWDQESEDVLQFTTTEGLSNNVVYATIEDEQERLWMPSDFGLMCFDKKYFTTTIYYPSDGIPHEEFNNASYCKTREGQLYMGGIKGVIGFDPEELAFPKPTMVNLIITGFAKNDPETGRLVDALVDFRKKEAITINPDENAFVLDFVMLHFRGARQIKYRYKIEGIDKEWIFIEDNTIRVNRLPYGKYTLRLKGQGGGQWSSPELEIPIEVIKPFYKKVWFYILLFLGLGSLLFLFVSWRISAVKKEKEQLELEVQKRTEQINEQKQKLEALNDTKDQFFGILAHDLRGPMLSFRGLSDKFRYLVENNKEERLGELSASVETAYSKLENLLDNLLNWALIQKGRLPYNPQQTSLHQASKEVIELFEEVAKIKEITLINEVKPKTLVFADQYGLSAILRNLINNAIKFSDKGTNIIISSGLDKNKTLVCQVRDQGVGIPPEELEVLFDFDLQKKKTQRAGNKKGTGLGLVLCKELIDLHGGVLLVESKEGKGTLVSFSFPPMN